MISNVFFSTWFNIFVPIEARPKESFLLKRKWTNIKYSIDPQLLSWTRDWSSRMRSQSIPNILSLGFTHLEIWRENQQNWSIIVVFFFKSLPVFFELLIWLLFFSIVISIFHLPPPPPSSYRVFFFHWASPKKVKVWKTEVRWG